ncbi:hypothetical protein SEA_EFRA2_87 [Mycobacterium phage Efra2]|nr:hypothetical protein SEA_EFRA2_87 [Mycobacterium phage Efra2]
MSIAEQYPARTDTNGRTWWRPLRPAGTDLSQWGWTSDPAQAHPDYDALNTCKPGRQSGLCLYCTCTDFDGRQCRDRDEASLADLVVEREAPVVAAAAERAEAYGDAWTAVVELAGGGRGVVVVPSDPQPVTSVGVLGDEWVQLGYVDETQGALW